MFLLHMDKYKAFKYFCNLILGNEYLLTLFSFKVHEVFTFLMSFYEFL